MSGPVGERLRALSRYGSPSSREAARKLCGGETPDRRETLALIETITRASKREKDALNANDTTDKAR